MTFIIADVGSNFCISDDPKKNKACAIRHIQDAALCGVDAVKFQLFTDQELYGFPGPNRYALPWSWIPDLAAECAEHNVEFMCTAFSAEGVQYLDPFVQRHKVASAEMKDTRILDAAMARMKPVIVSTGAAHFDEVAWLSRYHSDKFPNGKLCLMECVAAYPADATDYNLSVLADWREELMCDEVGISDHTCQGETALVALGAGATVFEVHFDAYGATGASKTPDAPASLSVPLLRLYVDNIRRGARMLSPRPKRPRQSEVDMTLRHRRRLKVVEHIKAGELLKFGVNFGSYRSIVNDTKAAGPEYWRHFDGKRAKHDMVPGDPVWHTEVE